jgi:hypothetical protein
VTAEAGRTVETTIRLQPARVVAKPVEDAPPPDPGPRVLVRLLRPDGTPYEGQVLTQSGSGRGAAVQAVDGRVSLDGFARGERFELVLFVRGHPRVRRAVEVEADSTDLGEIRLERGIDLRGTVLGADRTPLADARVLSDDDATGVSTDDRGAFVLAGQTPGRLSIAVFADGHVPHAVDVDVSPDSTPVEVVLARGASVRGSVRGPTGDPLPVGTWVTAKSLGDARGLDPHGFLLGVDGSFEARLRAGAHRFEVAGVPYGEWTFSEGETRDVVLSPEGR